MNCSKRNILTGALAAWIAGAALSSLAFTPMVPLTGLKILNLPAGIPGGNFGMNHLIDGNLKTEYASNDEGTNTVVELGFPKPTRITAMRHVDRNDNATVAVSELELFDANGQSVGKYSITHAKKRSGNTLFFLPSPVEASRAKWRVVQQGNRGLFSVGGAELTFFTSEPDDAVPSRDRIEVRMLPFVEKSGTRPVKVTIQHPYQETADVRVNLGDDTSKNVQLKSGDNVFEWNLSEVKTPTARKVEIQFQHQAIASADFQQSPARPMTIYIVPHSHTDIGYTEIQEAVAKKQVKNVADGIAAARRTANYPEGARFVWNVEAGWAADLFLERMDETQRQEFFDAVRKGQIALNGFYLNELTGLCRPEELIQLFRFATKMSQETGVPIDTAMISDVPGYTWGTVSAMAQAGIKYFSAAPNYFDRIGNILQVWENKPFYWVAPDGKNKVLVWIPFWGYAMSHIYHELSPRLITDFYDGLEKRNYPYDIAYVRWAGHGDNAVPDPVICDFVRDWNAKYQWPQFVISSASAAFHAFEEKHGKELPVVKGDWTPYWEDGAGSSALQTSQNRWSSDRLSQAATAFAMLNPGGYPVSDFNLAWRNVLLYSEHTWGAWCSITEPERKETIEQWAGKKGYADQAEERSRALLDQALNSKNADPTSNEINVVNTLSWKRSQLVTLTAEQSRAGDLVKDSKGKPVPSQRLSSGELVFFAQDIPPFSARRYTLSKGAAQRPKTAATASGNTLENGLVRVRVDERSGGIVELSAKGLDGNLVDTSSGEALNDYRYLIGDDVSKLQSNGTVKIHVGESGPLVASLVIESSAPGCKQLRRELRVVAGEDYVEVNNLVDKERLQAKSYRDESGKESVNFAFPFNVPDGQIVVDVPFGAARPELDQIPSACKNWMTVGRWVDVSNPDQGVTWVTLDAPLIEVGGITATLLNSQTNPDVWRKEIERTQKFYSWAMNNHWGTNYRAYQEGPTWFRFILRPHRGGTDPAEATRFATGFSQPLLVSHNGSAKQLNQPLLKLSSEDVVVTGWKPSDDHKGWIIRLFGASGKDQKVKLNWGEREPKAVFLSNTSELPGEKIGNSVNVRGFGVVTLRAEF
ncbi:MAG TPA: glycoside hydrolase family 38 C-terminal domain-containing protein [Verrucomicrobiae bacterium]|nr:glycoside hydrolase family 38 C-terminal domain-containing protein [Verrucomicrobiae bacterium]